MAYKAPYDERNEADYLELSRRIEIALKLIEDDPSIAATENSLASLAGCCRGTLFSRKYPLDRLRQIKNQRKQQKMLKFRNEKFVCRGEATTHRETISDLRSKLELSDQENAVLVQRYIAAEFEVAQLKRSQEALCRANEQLESEVKKLSKIKS